MNQIAIISDIHGNIPALEAVFEDINQREVKTIYCLGDLAGKGPSSAQAVDLCRERCEVVVRGNWDVFISAPAKHEVQKWHQAQLGPERLAYLAGLPNSFDMVISGRYVRLFHASQVNEFTRIYPFDPAEKLTAMFTNSGFTGYDRPAPSVVGYGDIHAAYVLPIYNIKKTLFNAGSVGNPLDEPTACYTILHGRSACIEPGGFSIEIVRLQYDIEHAIQDAYDAQMPEIEPYARELRTAKYRGRP